MTDVISFKWHGPGQCCCQEPGPYDWYRDSSAGDDITLNTEYFVRLASVITAPPMDSGAGYRNPSIDCWYIINDGEVDKEVISSCCGGYQSTGGTVSEIVITQELRGVDYYVVMYDCLDADPGGSPDNPYGIELDNYKYVDEDGIEDYENTIPTVIATMNTGWTIDAWLFDGEGTGYNKYVRGVVDFGPVTITPDTAYWVEFEYDSGSITKTSIEFDTSDMTNAEILETTWEDEEEPPSYETVYKWKYHPIPQAVAPRYWPMAAGVEHTMHGVDEPDDFTDGPLGTTMMTFECGARCLVGNMECIAGVPYGSFGFPDTEYGTVVCDENDGAGLYGRFDNLMLLNKRHVMEVQMFDASPGGFILLLHYRFTGYTGNLEAEGGIIATVYYYVRLYISGYSDNPTPIWDENDEESDSDWTSPWGGSCNAVQKHPSEDDYWLFCIPYKDPVEGKYRIRCYRSNGTLHWETPIANTYQEPTVLWSSDRWIYVTGLYLDATDIDTVTRGVWPQYELQNDHGDWLISHNVHPHDTEDDMPYYVPLGLRYQSNGDWILAGRFVASDLQFDTVKTSRLLSCAPDDEPY